MQKEIDKLTEVITIRRPEDPMHHEALRSRAQTLASVGRHREALEDAQSYMRLAAPDSGLLLFCATQKMAIGDLEGSLAETNRALANADAGPAAAVLIACRRRQPLGRSRPLGERAG